MSLTKTIKYIEKRTQGKRGITFYQMHKGDGKFSFNYIFIESPKNKFKR